MSELILPDRSLTISVTATSNWLGSGPDDLGATIRYNATDSKPNYPNAIDNDGNIYLGRMSSDKKYTDNLDITLNLIAQMTQRDGRTALADAGADGPQSAVIAGFCAGSTDGWVAVPQANRGHQPISASAAS